MSIHIDKLGGFLPPQDTKIEEAVLSACLVESDAPGRVMTLINPDDFYKDEHKEIFNAIRSLYHNKKPVDILTVTAKLKEMGKLDQVGGAYQISVISGLMTSSANLEYHATLLKQFSMLRSFINISSEDGRLAYADTTDPFKLLQDHLMKVERIFSGITPEMRHIEKVGISVVDKMHAAKDQTSEMIGYPSSLAKINENVLGWSGPDFIIISAAPGEGKTTFMINEILHVASTGVPVAVFSLEMNDEQLYWKMISNKIRAEVKDIRRGRLSDKQWEDLYYWQSELAKMNIYFYDVSGLDIMKATAIIKEAYRKHNVRMVFIDYIQLLTVSDRKQNREAEVNFISKRIKEVCRDLNIPVMALSQMSRDALKRKELYKPSDLRESGALEQDADVIGFIYHPESHDMYETNLYEKNSTGKLVNQSVDLKPDDYLFLIEKCRLGKTGKFRVKGNLAYNLFYDVDSIQDIEPDRDGQWNMDVFGDGKTIIGQTPF